MSLYRQGVTFGKANVGFEIFTPSAVRAELARVLAVLDAVNVDMSAAAKATPKKITQAEWNAWYQLYQSTHKFLTTASGHWGANVDQARKHETEIGKWRALLQQRGQAVTGPRDIIRPPDPPGMFSGGGMPGWLYPVMGIAGLLAVSQLIGNVKR